MTEISKFDIEGPFRLVLAAAACRIATADPAADYNATGRMCEPARNSGWKGEMIQGFSPDVRI